MTRSLVPCPVCNRHVFADASGCPFCASRLEAREPANASASPAPRHLGRAALLAAGAALLGAGACGSSVVPPYGLPPDDVRHDAGSTGGQGGGGAGGQGGAAGASAASDGGRG